MRAMQSRRHVEDMQLKRTAHVSHATELEMRRERKNKTLERAEWVVGRTKTLNLSSKPNRNRQFGGKNITDFLAIYQNEMQQRDVNDPKQTSSFKHVVKPGIRECIIKI
jgi:hypothetical protein